MLCIERIHLEQHLHQSEPMNLNQDLNKSKRIKFKKIKKNKIKKLLECRLNVLFQQLHYVSSVGGLEVLLAYHINLLF